MCWSRVRTLSATAVTGSSAPKMAVEVDPMQCMATVVQPSDTTVGNTARATRLIQPVAQGTGVNGVPMANMKIKTMLPKASCQKRSLSVGMACMVRDTFVITRYMAYVSDESITSATPIPLISIPAGARSKSTRPDPIMTRHSAVVARNRS